jgi:hypothetical protein
VADTINPLRLAQFFALPGAAELVEAFSAIPPGTVRDSLVSHAQSLAQASGWRLGQPIPTLPPESTPTAANGALQRQDGKVWLEWKGATPPPEIRQEFASASREGQIVEALLRGESVTTVAENFQVPRTVVDSLKHKARREGGLVFPSDRPRGVNWGRSKSSRSKPQFHQVRMPVPPPPYWWENPESPIWDNRFLLPGRSAPARGSMAAVGPLDRMVFVVMETAATRRGITLREYIRRRREAVRLVLSGIKPNEAAKLVGESPHIVSALLVQVGHGIMATARSLQMERAARSESSDD